jgi:uncharacterized protein
MAQLMPSAFEALPPLSLPLLGRLVGGGFLVGLGAALGNGCTSGHGICGLARLSPRSAAYTRRMVWTPRCPHASHSCQQASCRWD